MKNKSQHKGQVTPSTVPLRDAIHCWGISSRQFEKWYKKKLIKVGRNSEGEPCISKSDYLKISYAAETKNAAYTAYLRVAKSRHLDETADVAKPFGDECTNRIRAYRSAIGLLQAIHQKYSYRFDFFHDESPVAAAYIIYSKVISLLNMTCLCLEYQYWDARVLFRAIEEAINLANYFVLTQATPDGKRKLLAWYRENVIPLQRDIRTAIAEYMKSHLPVELKSKIEPSLKALYQAKSKAVHHDYRGTMEVYHTKIENGGIVRKDFNYGACSDSRKILELTSFFYAAGIVPAYQGFYSCFVKQIPFDEDDLHTLNRHCTTLE